MASTVWRHDPKEILQRRPSLSTYLIPIDDAYVVFRLNPVATLEALKDPIATEQAAALTTKKYVGYISRVLDFTVSPERRFHQFKCTCHLLSNSIPVASAADHTEETMFVPIAPATHPEGRMALSPTPPLPWSGLCHHTLNAIDLRVSTDRGPDIDHSLSPMIPYDQDSYMARVIKTDVLRQSYLRAVYEAAHPQPSNTTPFPRSSSANPYRRRVDWTQEVLRDPFGSWEDPESQFMPVVDFDVDLSTVAEFTDAKHFFEEIAALKRIRAESEARRRVRKERLAVQRLEKEREHSAATAQHSHKSSSLVSRLTGKTRAKVESKSSSEKTLVPDGKLKARRVGLPRYDTIKNGIASLSRVVISVARRSCLPPRRVWQTSAQIGCRI
ncbi:hypothetical protein FA95DRAFT_510865 [Auriscalpium vulgare]|uniref:Uncharacterized protein n=1 Tax=Auriscalpium vulgare TaxID=40419 RepID=A0ACB8RFM3_9AGAM|nr:hypothetical protein FA95DRAFT_510865 [Auriscalpium vulgare]